MATTAPPTDTTLPTLCALDHATLAGSATQTALLAEALAGDPSLVGVARITAHVPADCTVVRLGGDE